MRRLDPPRSRDVARPAWPRVLRRRAELAPEVAREPNALATRAEEPGVPEDRPDLRLTGPAVETIKLEAELDATDQLEKPGDNRTAVEFGLHPQIAVLEGNPGEKGPVTLRLRFPANYDIPAHWHSMDERLTVLSGTFHVGMGDKLDRRASQAAEASDRAWLYNVLTELKGG